LENENKKTLIRAAALGSAPHSAELVRPENYCFVGACPKISIGLAVVGIAASRSQGIGMPDAELIT
jgi:hypothetical protein